MIKGIDISKWQSVGGVLKYSTLGKDDGGPIDFCICKATEGRTYVDPWFDSFAKDVKNKGLLFGAYHYARPELGNTAKSEAANFVSKIRPYIGKCLLALDWEGKAIKYTAWAREWLDAVYEMTGVKPLIYMSASTLKSKRKELSAIADKDYGLWLAIWPKDYASVISGKTKRPNVKISPWPVLAIWQWAGGTPNGVDMDIFYGGRDAWTAYCKSDATENSREEGYCQCGCSCCGTKG